ncbi:discoidin domain-containing protein [Phytohabitans kaempferiae]|uniref:Discoidin domain-containing protein n=1 Tax=Phytohabitans kaempferiae TaxID=1620943 RepID=A0ABV6LXK1_9ACTN
MTDVPARMLDGDAGTRWTTGTPMVAGQSITVDMRAVRSVGGFSLLSTGSDHARGYRVYLSTDGVSWGTPVAVGVGAPNADHGDV